MMVGEEEKQEKELHYGSGCEKALEGFPNDVRATMLHALRMAQKGLKHPDAKPLRGFHGASLLEVVVSFDKNAYRGIYTIQFKEVLYVLHVFQKKSKSGISTPKKEIDLIKKRLAGAEHHYKENYQ